MKLACQSALAVAPSFVFVLVGCVASPADVKEGTRDTIGAVNDAKSALSAEHLKAAMGDIDGLKAQIKSGNERMDALYNEANRRYVEQKEAEQKIGNLGAVALTVADFATNGRASTIVDRFTQSIDDTRQRIDETSRSLAEDLKVVGETAKRETERASEDAQKARESIRDVDGRVADVEHSVARAEDRLKSLTDDTRERLAKINPADIDALKLDLANPERFKERVNGILADAGVADAERSKILGLNPEEIMAILLAAGGSTFAARKMSKSQPQIDELYQKQEESMKEAAKLRSTIAALHGANRMPAES